MTDIAVKPRVFKNYKLQLGDDNYEAHVSGVTFTPSASVQTWTGADGESHSDTSVATWVCQLDYAQDWETDESLSIFLLNHEGEHIVTKFFPLDAGPNITATIIITPGAIGGAVGSYGTASVSCGVDGKPVFAAASGGA
jgi:hypothetical protein